LTDVAARTTFPAVRALVPFVLVAIAGCEKAGVAEPAAPAPTPAAAPAPASPPSAAPPAPASPPAAAAPAEPAAAATPKDAAPSLAVEPASAKPGDEVRVTFTAPGFWPKNAWVGLVPASVPHGSEATNDDHDESYRHLDGRTTGTLVFRAPAEPGAWEARLHDDDDGGKEVASAPFQVVPAAP
jgi:hypothetical protein